MLEFCAWVSHCGDVADLLELERSLESDGIVVLPSHEEHHLGLGISAGDRCDLGFELENPLDLGRKFLQFRDDPASRRAGEIANASEK